MLFYLIVIVVAVANLSLGYAAARHLGYVGRSAPRYYVAPPAQDAAKATPPSNAK